MSDQRSDVCELLSRLAVRATAPAYDARHAVLDVAQEFLDIDPDVRGLPQRLAAELQDLRGEIRAVLPPFPSRRNTSPLFDRAGLGRVGYERAERLVQRLVALAKAVRGFAAKESGTRR